MVIGRKMVTVRRWYAPLIATVLLVLTALAVFFTTQSAQALSVWNDSTTPSTLADSDTASVELGMKFRSSQATKVTGVKFYKGQQNTGTHTGTLWSKTGQQLASVVFTDETSQGWQTASFSTPVTIAADTTYVVSYHAPNGKYSVDQNYFASNAATNGHLTALKNGTDGGNGVYKYGSAVAFPTQSYKSSNYWVDVTTEEIDTTAPTVSISSPADNSTVSGEVAVDANATDNVAVAKVEFKLDGDSLGSAVTSSPYTATWDTTAVDNGDYTLTAVATDTSDNVTTSSPVTVTVNNQAPVTETSLWDDSATPTVAAANDNSAVELGVKFRSSVAATVTGAKFYKGATNTGTHTASLWSSNGTRLATGTFADETATGWQTLQFASPVEIAADTTYVISYYAPAGNYAYDGNYFTTPRTNQNLTAPASGNGVYKYGASGYPTSSYQAANYWVDVITTTQTTPEEPPVDSAAPAVPANLAAGTVTTGSVPLTWTASTDDTAVTGYQVLRNGTQIATPTSPNYTDNTVAADTVYSYTVKAYDAAGNTSAASSPLSVTTPEVVSTAVPAPWQTSDIGSTGVAGSASYANGTFTVKGSGVDIWDKADSFRYVYQPLSGDGEITARVASQQNTHQWALAGVMIRENLNANSRQAIAAVTPSNGASFTSRSTTGENSNYVNGNAASAPYWLRLNRSGNVFTAYKSANGTSWTQFAQKTIAMDSSAYVGLAVSSHNNSVLATDTFNNVSVDGNSSEPPAEPPVDTTAPVLSSITTNNVTTSSATVTWATDEASDSQVEYGKTAAYGSQTPVTSSMDTSHSTTLSGLEADTTYYYRVLSTDAAGNVATSTSKTFTTLEDTVVTPPTSGCSADKAVITATQVANLQNSGYPQGTEVYVPGSPDPWGGCFPGPENTGIPAGTTLTDYTGSCEVITPNLVIDGKTITCHTMYIRAANVTIKNSKFIGSNIKAENSNFTIIDTEADFGTDKDGQALTGEDITGERLNFYGGHRQVWCGDCVIEDSYFHGQDISENPESHASAMRTGSNTTYRHNTIACDVAATPQDGGCSAAQTGYPDFGPIHNNTVEKNFIVAPSTAGYCVYGGWNVGKPYNNDPLNATNIKFKDNVIQRGTRPNDSQIPLTNKDRYTCGLWGVGASFNDSREGFEFTGNMWDDGLLFADDTASPYYPFY